MILFIIILIFIVITIISLLLLQYNKIDDSSIFLFIFSVSLFMNVALPICFVYKTYMKEIEFNEIVSERDTLQNVIDFGYIKLNSSEYIVEKIIKINNEIKNIKKDNQLAGYDWFIDDRIDTLQIIKGKNK